MVTADGRFAHRRVRDLPLYLRAPDVLVVNDTKVLRARLRGQRVGRGDSEPKIEVLLHKRLGPDRFLAFARPARKLAPADRLLLGRDLAATVAARGAGGEIELAFDRARRHAGSGDRGARARCRCRPISPASGPPMRRTPWTTRRSSRGTRARSPPRPRGLHFTPGLLARLTEQGVSQASVTLHVGAGTFLPVSVDDTADHRMHPEWASLDSATAAQLNAARANGGRIVAVGTTSLRTLESAAGPDGAIRPLAGETDIFITPGHRFAAVDVLLTNFHLPRSTLFMLVSAFCGLATMQAAYAEAIREHYRFYSYGDACLLFRPEG